MLTSAAQRILNLTNQCESLTREIAFLEKLPKDLTVSSVRESVAIWHVTVSAPLPQLLKTLPPANAGMREKDGMWIGAPEPRPLDFSQLVLGVSESSSGVRWFHYLEDGTLMLVTADKAKLPELPGYTIRSNGRHERVLVRKLRQPPSQRVDPGVQDRDAWNAFMQQECYGARQKQFGYMLATIANRGIDLSMDMLPVPAASVMKIGDNELVICRSGGPEAEQLPEGSPLTPLVQMGSFWTAFSREQAERLIDFAKSRRKNLPEVQALAYAEQMALIKDALSQFQDLYLATPPADEPMAHAFEYWIKKQTGIQASVTVSHDRPRRKQGHLELRVHLWWHKGEEITLAWPQGEFEPTGFSFVSPTFYEYEDNTGRI